MRFYAVTIEEEGEPIIDQFYTSEYLADRYIGIRDRIDGLYREYTQYDIPIQGNRVWTIEDGTYEYPVLLGVYPTEGEAMENLHRFEGDVHVYSYPIQDSIDEDDTHA